MKTIELILLCLSLSQPFAELVVLGHKRLGSRTWTRKHRGTLGIHSTRNLQPEDRRLIYDDREVARRLYDAGYPEPSDLPLGAVIGQVDLVDIQPWEACRGQIGELENRLESFGPGRYVWFFERAVRYERPIPAQGHQSLWEWEPHFATTHGIMLPPHGLQG